jgi:hypothetical protein
VARVQGINAENSGSPNYDDELNYDDHNDEPNYDDHND